MMDYAGDFNGIKSNKAATMANPLTQPRQIRTAKANYHIGAGLTETSGGQVLSRIK